MNLIQNTQPLAVPDMIFGRQVQKQFKSDIILGSPGMACQGVGICRVMAHGEILVCKCPKVPAWLMVTELGNLRVSFQKSEMNSTFIEKHFEWMVFQVQEAYEMPRRITRALGINRTIIRPGTYQVWDTPQFLIIDF